MRTQIVCNLCGKSLTGGWDTFGDTGHELCQECYSDVTEQENMQSWYGVGPHHHDLIISGSIIGSTVLDPLPEPNADGDYEIEPGLFFTPDPDVDGLGTWTQK